MEVFSEGRALITTSALADDIGDRAVNPNKSACSFCLQCGSQKEQSKLRVVPENFSNFCKKNCQIVRECNLHRSLAEGYHTLVQCASATMRKMCRPALVQQRRQQQQRPLGTDLQQKVHRTKRGAGDVVSTGIACFAQVTTPGNEVAAQYLYDRALEMQAFAAEHRPDLDVQVIAAYPDSGLCETGSTSTNRSHWLPVLLQWPERLGRYPCSTQVRLCSDLCGCTSGHFHRESGADRSEHAILTP